MKIMIVDNDEIALAVAKKVLEKDRHQVLLVDDGNCALDILRHNEVQMVISDWNMPAVSGLDLCRYTRSLPASGYVYMTLVTSHTNKEDIYLGLSAGADDFISKPFEPAELLLRVRNAERMLSLESTSAALFHLAKLAEAKNIETDKHLERIRAYSAALAEKIISDPAIRARVEPHFPDLLFRASPLHDIGKAGIPDHILLKSANLSDEEWKVMKSHTEIGAETLAASLQIYPHADFLRTARDIAWCHHERWDGSGYPRGLKGEEIPLCARIVALADVFDTLSMKGLYKSAMSEDIAHRIVIEGRNTQFDPIVVQAFLDSENLFQQIKENH